MTSRTTDTFRKLLSGLPADVKEQANSAYRKWKVNPKHPGLQFKRIHGSEPIYSVRINLNWRALCTFEGETAVWFWIGSHTEFDRLARAFNKS